MIYFVHEYLFNNIILFISPVMYPSAQDIRITSINKTDLIDYLCLKTINNSSREKRQRKRNKVTHFDH